MKIKYSNNNLKTIVNARLIEKLILLMLFFVSVVSAQSNVEKYSLEDCIQIALQNNPGIKSSLYNVNESQLKIKESKGGLFPNLNFNTSTNRYYSENQSGSFISNDNLSAGLSTRYNIFQGFKTTASVEAAKENYNSNIAQHSVNTEDLILGVTESYYKLLQTERIVKTTEKAIERSKLYLDYAEARYKNGLASQSDLLKAKVEFSNSELALIRSRNARLTVKGSLNTLLGNTASDQISIIDNLETTTFGKLNDSLSIQENISELIQTAYQNRPEIIRIQSQMNAQRSYLTIARSEYFPTLSLDANYNYAGETTADLRAISFVGLSLNFPIFNGFSSEARVDEEKIALKNIEQQDLSLRNQISLEVWNAYLSVKESVELINNTKIFYENALENLRIAEGEYKEGVGSMLSLVDAQTNLVTAEESYIEVLANYGISVASLKRVVGNKNIEEILN
ncbi:MAG: TolC family protein [Ignavibacteriae bacterium]|nr:TolC family protein [Ignavibacteriota bacterium]